MSNANNNPNINSDDYELLSAYLDHELSESDYARVEMMLAENAQARSMLDDLKRSRSAVAGLPVYPGTGKSVDWGLVAQQIDRGSEATSDDLEENEAFVVPQASDEALVRDESDPMADRSHEQQEIMEDDYEPDERPTREVIAPVRSKYGWVMPIASAACLLLAIGLGYGLLMRESGDKLEVSSRVLTNEKSADLPDIRDIAKGEIDPSQKALVDNAGMAYPPMAERAFKGPLPPAKSPDELPDLYDPNPANQRLPDLADLANGLASNDSSLNEATTLEQLSQQTEDFEMNRRIAPDSRSSSGGEIGDRTFNASPGTTTESTTSMPSRETLPDSIEVNQDTPAEAYSAESAPAATMQTLTEPQLADVGGTQPQTESQVQPSDPATDVPPRDLETYSINPPASASGLSEEERREGTSSFEETQRERSEQSQSSVQPPQIAMSDTQDDPQPGAPSTPEQLTAPLAESSQQPMQSRANSATSNGFESKAGASAMAMDAAASDNSRADGYPFHQEATSIPLSKNLVVARTSSWTTAELESEFGDNNLLASAAGLPTERQAELRSRYNVNRSNSDGQLRRAASPLIVTTRPASVKPDEVVSRLQRSAPVTQVTSDAAVAFDADAAESNESLNKLGQASAQQGEIGESEQTVILFVNPYEADLLLAEFPTDDTESTERDSQQAGSSELGSNTNSSADSSGLQRTGRRQSQSPPMRIYQRSDVGSTNSPVSERVVLVLTPPE